jgi:putative flippase GtrA
MFNKLWSLRGVRFIAVGILNTLVDFSILNLLVFAFGLNNIAANTISVSIAMLVSYMLNHQVVFRYEGKNHAKKFLIFIAISAFGLLVLQNLVIYSLVHLFTWPADVLTTLIHGIGFKSLTNEFITLNFAKAVGTGVTMVWNYFMYRRFVFNKTLGK